MFRRTLTAVLFLFILIGLTGIGGAFSPALGETSGGKIDPVAPRDDTPILINPDIYINPDFRIEIPPLYLNPVSMYLPGGELYVGSYYRVPVSIAIGSTFTFDDLKFVVTAGTKGGIASQSRDETFDPSNPHIMLLAGYEPGNYELQAINNLDGTVVGSASYVLSTTWMDYGAGPSRWMAGAVGNYSIGSAWGGGGAGPQNIDVCPATGTRRIAIVLVDTTSALYTTDAPTLTGFQTRWMDNTINGVADSDLIVRSARQFYREASYNTFDISAEVFGPVHVPQAWDVAMSGDWAQAVITAADSVVNYNNFESVLMVCQSVPSTSVFYALNPDGTQKVGPDGLPIQLGNFTWPSAWGGAYSTAEGTRNLAVIAMPNEWGVTIRPDRTLNSTIAHELGHNLGLPDEYMESDAFTPAVVARQIAGWDIMAYESQWPHFSAANLLRLGWIDAPWVRTFNFQSMGVPVDATVTLHPTELGAPPAGRFSCIEIRIADGVNYYFEYRNGQVVQIGDRYLPTNSRVLGTDVYSDLGTAPIVRRSIMILNNDADGDGPVLGNGADYEETDFTDPVYPTDFKVDVSGIDGSKADVRIRYGVNSRPDPSIRPWPSPTNQWQSPDIDVRNARNLADPAWANVPWEGNMNTIVARVKNNGGLDAPSVRANFYVKNFNVGGAPETLLGSDIDNVPAGGTVEFTAAWVPPTSGHFCIIVRMPLYQNPADMTVVEMTDSNNTAQSNYDRFISRTGSPPSREQTYVEVGNPFSYPTRIWITAGQTNPLYRTYVEHVWVWLQPGETRKVGIMFEYSPENMTLLPGATYIPSMPTLSYVPQNPELRKWVGLPNDSSICAFIENRNYDTPQLLGGVSVQIATGMKTRFQTYNPTGTDVSGTLIAEATGQAVVGGQVVIRIAKDATTTEFEYITTPVRERGFFSEKFRNQYPDGTIISAFYIPAPGYADCEISTTLGLLPIYTFEYIQPQVYTPGTVQPSN